MLFTLYIYRRKNKTNQYEAEILDEESSDEYGSVYSQSSSKASELSLNKSGSEIDSSSESDLSSSDNEIIEEKSTMEYIKELIVRVRKLSKCVRKSTKISSFVSKIAKQENFAASTLKIDFHIRWNTTYLMLQRFIQFRQIVTKITEFPRHIENLTKAQVEKLSNLCFSNDDWKHLEMLLSLLRPFFEATKMISGSKYLTLPLSYIIKKILFKFFERPNNDKTESELKKIILNKMKYYLIDKISNKQHNAILVSNVYTVYPKNCRHSIKRNIKKSFIIICLTANLG